MYRPENWKNPYMLGVDGSGQEDLLYEGWEAGADAMLEALFKMAKESPTGTFVIDSKEVNIFGDIPEES